MLLRSTLLTLASISVLSSALPFSSSLPSDPLHRRATRPYSVVQVDGGASGEETGPSPSTTTEIRTVTETPSISSTTQTVTATMKATLSTTTIVRPTIIVDVEEPEKPHSRTSVTAPAATHLPSIPTSTSSPFSIPASTSTSCTTPKALPTTSTPSRPAAGYGLAAAGVPNVTSSNSSIPSPSSTSTQTSSAIATSTTHTPDDGLWHTTYPPWTDSYANTAAATASPTIILYASGTANTAIATTSSVVPSTTASRSVQEPPVDHGKLLARSQKAVKGPWKKTSPMRVRPN